MTTTQIYGHKVIWTGTAEVNYGAADGRGNESRRVPGALVSRSQRGDKVLVKWGRKWISESDAVFSREYEGANGELIGTIDAALAARIDAALTANRTP